MDKYSKITITIPTKGRRARLAACLRSIDYKPSRVIIGSASIKDIPGDAIEKTFFETLHLVNIVSEDAYPVPVQNLLAKKSDGASHILPISDDIVFEPGAIQSAVNSLISSFPDSDGIIGFDIKNMNQKDKCLYAYMLVGSKFFNERLNRNLFHEEYYHFFADMELGEYAQKLGRFRTCPEAGLLHFHPSAGHAADETHRYRRQEKWNHDHTIYINRIESACERSFLEEKIII